MHFEIYSLLCCFYWGGTQISERIKDVIKALLEKYKQMVILWKQN